MLRSLVGSEMCIRDRPKDHFHLPTLGVLYFFCIDFDVFNSFDLEDGLNGVHQADDGLGGIYLKKTSEHIVASPDILKEFVGAMNIHPSFIVTFKMQPEGFHKGSLIWLEEKKTGNGWSIDLSTHIIDTRCVYLEHD